MSLFTKPLYASWSNYVNIWYNSENFRYILNNFFFLFLFDFTLNLDNFVTKNFSSDIILPMEEFRLKWNTCFHAFEIMNSFGKIVPSYLMKNNYICFSFRSSTLFLKTLNLSFLLIYSSNYYDEHNQPIIFI